MYSKQITLHFTHFFPIPTGQHIGFFVFYFMVYLQKILY